MESCGLPELPGRPPLGGPILSHDFVEAALLRRAGWSVRIADDLPGSYEAARPPSSISPSATVAGVRETCNTPAVLGAKGLHWVSRFHLLSGIFSFVSSPIWLLFLFAALALGVQNEFARPEYFTRSFSLFPVWPHIDPVRALRTFILSLAILGAPKALGDPGLRRKPERPGVRWAAAASVQRRVRAGALGVARSDPDADPLRAGGEHPGRTRLRLEAAAARRPELAVDGGRLSAPLARRRGSGAWPSSATRSPGKWLPGFCRLRSAWWRRCRCRC